MVGGDVFSSEDYHNPVRHSLSRPVQKILVAKLINSPKVKDFNLTAVGNSMRPLINTGDLLHCRRLAETKIPGFGQIAVIWDKNDFLAHRVIWKRRNGLRWSLLTKGDFRLEADGWIGEDRIIAVVTGRTQGREFNKTDEILIGVLSLMVYFLPSFFKNFLRKVKKSIA